LSISFNLSYSSSDLKTRVYSVPSGPPEKNKEIVDVFKIITYLQQNIVSIHHISSDPGCDMVFEQHGSFDY